MLHHRQGTKVGGTFRACSSLLNSQETMKRFLELLTEKLEMNDLNTVIYDVATELKRVGKPIESDEGGVTGVTVYTTSHGAFHTWPEEGAATFDIHSCRCFKVSTVYALIQEFFDTNDIEIYDLSFSLGPKKANIFEDEYVLYNAEGAS